MLKKILELENLPKFLIAKIVSEFETEDLKGNKEFFNPNEIVIILKDKNVFYSIEKEKYFKLKSLKYFSIINPKNLKIHWYLFLK